MSQPKKRGTGCVYLIHFDQKFRHAGHYIGYTKNRLPDKRVESHRRGEGARLMRVVTDAGIAWRVARVWMGASRSDERKLKNRNGAARFCPVCQYSGRKQTTYVPQATTT